MFDMSRVIEIVVAAVVLLSIVFLVWSSYTTSLLGKDFWVWLPFLGKMAKWSRGDERTGEHDDSPGTMIPVEKALYDYYKNGVPETSRKSFDRYRKYLVLAKQSDRRPMSAWMWAILFGLTVAEAFGTGALIAPLISREITPDGALFIGAALAFVLAVVTLLFTHNAGHDLYHNSLVSHIAANFRQRGGFVVGGKDKAVEAISVISPDMDQDKDESNAPMTRLAARLGINTLGDAKKRYGNIVAATSLIVLAFVLSTWYRHDELNKHLDSEAVGMSAPSSASAAGGTQSFQNMFSSSSASGAGGDTPLPAAVAQAAQQSQKKATDAIISDKKSANDVGVVLLGVIYLFTQFLGVVTGYKYGFFGENAEQAYKETKGYPSYDTFLGHVVKPVSQRATMRMTTLRSNLSKMNPTYRPSIFDFMEMYIADARPPRETVDLSDQPENRPAREAVGLSDEQICALAEKTLSLPSREERVSFVSGQNLLPKDRERFQSALATAKEKRKATESAGLSQDLLDALGD
ncbi:hypothetical protein [Acidithiobacillus sulfuriphilus]|uniref:Uncharacterized protein n=2 Tax=Acidithiobacillus sulfuriphilus TaxID=1867749 RepID=A0A3M8R342_9PROT|nr:hypothetical protein [Acidithiobacillus sulfuriphilus]RNF62976.1 hypothetical protein EC580_06915 [Acidithiobacillus sulfuriphilus]